MSMIEQEQANTQVTPILSMIERVATDPNADIEKLEKMLDMQERVLNRESEMEYNAAMSALQAEMPTIHKGGKAHNSTYARYEDINAAIKPLLARNGFSVSFRSDFNNNMLEVKGIIAHKSGHREETTMCLPYDTSGSKNGIQAIGSSVTYGKRYVLCMLFNIATSDDDDANYSSSPLEEISQLLGKSSKACRDAFFTKCQVDKVDDISTDKLEAALTWLKGKAS
jgi:hypothetical protein